MNLTDADLVNILTSAKLVVSARETLATAVDEHSTATGATRIKLGGVVAICEKARDNAVSAFCASCDAAGVAKSDRGQVFAFVTGA